MTAGPPRFAPSRARWATTGPGPRPGQMRSTGGPALLALVSTALCVLASACAAGPAGPPGPVTGSVSSSPAPQQRSGIRGVTMVDGGCPVVRSAAPCPDRPVAAKVTAGEGATVRSVVSDSTGRFELALPPGTYQVQASSPDGSPVPVAGARPVVVHPAAFTTVTIHLDSGVR